MDLTKHGEIVDVRVDGLDHVENLSFDTENVAHDFDMAKPDGTDVPDPLRFTGGRERDTPGRVVRLPLGISGFRSCLR